MDYFEARRIWRGNSSQNSYAGALKNQEILEQNRNSAEAKVRRPQHDRKSETLHSTVVKPEKFEIHKTATA